jgi:Spy/CpxP family protein refolding chaperone
VKLLSLTADQQKHLDQIFLDNRVQLIHMHASLEEEQLKLEPLLSANPLDQGKALAEISAIADLRADLEKTDAKMLLSLRAVLTPDQWTKLQADQHSHREGMRGDRGRRNPDGPGGQGGPGGPPPPGASESNPNDSPQ